jgi:hypothetical protein
MALCGIHMYQIFNKHGFLSRASRKRTQIFLQMHSVGEREEATETMRIFEYVVQFIFACTNKTTSTDRRLTDSLSRDKLETRSIPVGQGAHIDMYICSHHVVMCSFS